MNRGEMDATLAEMVGEDDEGHFSAVNFRDYLSAVRPVFELDGERGEAVVGVIVASGMILDGKQPAGNVGGDSRSFQLAQEIDEAQVTAKYTDGVLELTLPKKAATQARRITIQ